MAEEEKKTNAGKAESEANEIHITAHVLCDFVPLCGFLSIFVAICGCFFVKSRKQEEAKKIFFFTNHKASVFF